MQIATDSDGSCSSNNLGRDGLHLCGTQFSGDPGNSRLKLPVQAIVEHPGGEEAMESLSNDRPLD
jgi:hypothetical protein